MRLFDYLKDEIITVTVMISVTCLVMLILAVFNCPDFFSSLHSTSARLAHL